MHPDNLNWLILTLIIAIIIVGLSLLLIISYSVTLFNNRSKHQQEIIQLKILNHNRELQSEIAVQEQTFEQIAREVHDNWGQRLTLVKFHLQVMELPSLEQPLQLLDQLLEELRSFSRSLSSSRIKKIGLVRAIEEDIDFLKGVSEIKFSFDVYPGSHTPDEYNSIVLYRIFQEAESNILKHAKASEVNVNLREEQGNVSFEISDNGVGFDPVNHQSKGIGLHNILRRARLINATCQFNSSPGKGTQIFIQTKKNTHDTGKLS